MRRPTSPVPGLLPGINHILPYAAPTFQDESNQEAIFQLSRCCLESSRDVIYTLEQEYRTLYARNLTLSRRSEAVILPLCALSVAVYLFRGGLDVMAALPYLIGGTVGGWAGGKWFRGMKMPWLKRAFGLLLIYGGVRSFL